MWVFGIFVVVSIAVFIAGYRLIASAPDDPPPPDLPEGETSRRRNGGEPARTVRGSGDAEAPSTAAQALASSERFAIHYNRFLAAFLFASSLVILAFSLIAGLSMNSIAGFILLFVSVAYFVQPALVVTGSAVQHRNVLGMTMRRTTFSALSDFVFENGTVWVKQTTSSPSETKDPARVKVIGIRFLYSGGDIAKLEERVRQSKG